VLSGAGAGAGVIWLIRQCGKSLRRALRPRPRLRLTPGTPATGERFQVEWEFPGARPVQSLRMWLEATEEAKVREQVGSIHGAISTEKTHRSPFLNLALLETAGAAFNQPTPHSDPFPIRWGEGDAIPSSGITDVTAETHPSSGRVSGRVPAGAMHSFRGEKCAVLWKIKVSFACPGGKPQEYSFPMNVRPGKL
jgi:hypothetical protein